MLLAVSAIAGGVLAAVVIFVPLDGFGTALATSGLLLARTPSSAVPAIVPESVQA